MKKYLSLLSLILLFALSACAESESPAPSTPVAPETETTPPETDTSDSATEGDINQGDGDEPVESTPPVTDQPMDDSDENDDAGVDDEADVEDDTEVDDEADVEDDIMTGIETDENGNLLLTLSQLSRFDGREGRRAFIAVAGIVYEVTSSPRWRNGIHNGDPSIAAGNDLTSQIDSTSPHGRRVLDNIPVVGRIIQD